MHHHSDQIVATSHHTVGAYIAARRPASSGMIATAMPRARFARAERGNREYGFARNKLTGLCVHPRNARELVTSPAAPLLPTNATYLAQRVLTEVKVV